MNSEWKEVKLGSLIDVLTDYHSNGAYKKLKENVELLDEENYAFMVRTTNFEQDNFSSNNKYITKEAYEFMSKSKVFPCDLVMNKIANAGSIYFMPDLNRPVSLAMNLFLIRINNNLAYPRYVYYNLKANEKYVKSFAQGSVTKTITKNAVRNLVLNLPPFHEQKAITQILGTLDDKIELNRKMNETLEQMAQTLFNSWFIDFDPVMDNAIAKGNKVPDTLKHKLEQRKEVLASGKYKVLSKEIMDLFPSSFEYNEELEKWIPEGWKIEALGENLYVKGRIGWKGLKRSEYLKENTGYKILNGSDFVDEQIDPDLSHYIPKDRYDESPEIQLKQHDILITKDGTIGKLAFVNKLSNRISVASGVFVVRVKTDRLGTMFCWSYFKSSLFQRVVKTKIDGSVIPHLYQRDFVEMMIPMPERSLLNQYEILVSSFYEKTFENKEEITKLKRVRDLLLPQLISGKLRIKEKQKYEQV